MGAISSLVKIEPLPPSEAEAALPLSAEANWNQTAADWHMMLREGHGFGLRGEDNRWIASSLVFPLGSRLWWISMVLVARRARRRGYGTQLLRHCVDTIRARGGLAGLDATELGRPVYLPLGFRDLYAISRFVLPQPPSTSSLSREAAVRPLRADDLGRLDAFDFPHSAMRRPHVLAFLLAQAPDQASVVEARGRIRGYILGRPGRGAFQLGPVVADEAPVAIALVARALATLRGTVMMDVPDAHSELQSFLRSRGASRQRGYTRMALGDAPPGLDDPRGIYALAGPELG